MVTVVYPYVHKYAQFNELLYSIRSMATHFKEEFNLVVIGDKPSWLSDEAIFINAAVISNVPVKDVASKMKKIIAADFVSENFIWMNDDIYAVNDVSLSDIATPKAIEDLDELYINGRGLYNTNYRRNMWQTYNVLKSEGLPAVNTCTHLPFYYNKQLLSHVLSKYDVGTNLYLITLLYHNNLFKKEEYLLVGNYSGFKSALYQNKVGSHQELDAKNQKSKFFNHSDTGFEKSKKAIAEYLAIKFNQKCRFEK